MDESFQSTFTVESIEFDPNDSSSILGKGSYAQVLLARDPKTLKLFALKIVC